MSQASLTTKQPTMNDAPSPTDSIHSLDRRHFVRKSAFATGALTFAGLISAGHAGPPSTTTNTTTTTTVSTYVWWKDYSFEVDEPVNFSDADVDNAEGDNLDEKHNNAAIKRFVEATINPPYHTEIRQGGTPVNPFEYELLEGSFTIDEDADPNSDGGTATVTQLVKIRVHQRQ
jgi:hypothetical protein